MADKTNGLSPPQGGGFHRLPQIPTMSRNVKIAQSKNTKFEVVTEDAVDKTAVIHIEGTDKVVKISSDGVTETVDEPPPAATDKETDSQQEEQTTPTATETEKKPRKGRRSVKLDPDSADVPKGTEKGSTTTPEVGRRRGRSSPKGDSVKKTEQQTPQGKAVVEGGPDTPKSESTRGTPKTNPKQESGRKGRRNMSWLSLPHEEQKPTDVAAAEQQSTVSSLESTKTSTLSPDGVDVSPKTASTAPGSVIRSILESSSDKYQSMINKKNESSPSLPAPHVDEIEGKDAKQESADPKPAAPEDKKQTQKGEKPNAYYSGAGRILPRTVLLRESEKPSDVQLARLMEGKSNQYDVSHPVKWRIGDLLWGHVSGHPWWPGMISSDPFSGLFTTIKGGSRISRLYHVQYFGDEAERGWVGESSSMAFEGKKKLLDMGIAQIKATKDRSKKNKLQQAFCPNQRRKAAWDLAVGEAEDAMTLDKETRIDKYTFVYEFLPNKQATKASLSSKSASSSPSVNTEKRGQKRKEPASNMAEGSEAEVSAPKRQRRDIATPTVVQRSRGGREEGSFETYCIKHREFVREEHPEYSGAMVIEALKQQWALMTPQQRLRYKSKFSGMDVDSPQG